MRVPGVRGTRMIAAAGVTMRTPRARSNVKLGGRSRGTTHGASKRV